MVSNSIDISEASGIRYLHFGSDWVQGAMRIRRPVDLVLEYTREMMFGLLLRDGFNSDARWPKRILLIGLGAGSLTKFCYWRLPQARVTTVEIDASVWATASFHFKLPAEDERLSIVIEDGVDYMMRPDSKFDYILVDGYDENAQVGLLDSLPFYQACWARLNEGGIFSTNLFGRSPKLQTTLQNLNEAFEGRTLALPQCDSGNRVALATRGTALEVGREALIQRNAALQINTGLDLSSTLERLFAHGNNGLSSIRL